MIDKVVYGIDYIKELQKKYTSDPGLIERAIYAFGLLEAIKKVGMPFCFKGGTRAKISIYVSTAMIMQAFFVSIAIMPLYIILFTEKILFS